MRRRLVVLSVVLALVGSACDWLQWGGGPQHPGGVFETSLGKSNVGAAVALPIFGMPATTSVSVFGKLGFVAQDGELRAFDTSNNGIVWTAALPSGVTGGSAPAIDAASGNVFITVARPAPLLVGFDANGIKNCNASFNTCAPTFWAELGSAPGTASPPLVSGPRVFANGASALYAFDAAGQFNCVTFGAQICAPLWSATTGYSAAGVGPAANNGVVYDAVANGGTAIAAFNESSGAALWRGALGAPVSATPSIAGDGTVIVPAGGEIAGFPGGGCGSPTCFASFTFVVKSGDPAGNFFGTPTFDGSSVFATNTNGSLYRYPASGCTIGCQPNGSVAVNTPADASFRQAVAAGNGVLYLLAKQLVGGTSHVKLLAFDASNLAPLTNRDLGEQGFASGIASASLASGVVYAPVANAVVGLHLPAVTPLASLSTSPLTVRPAFAPSIFDYALRCNAGTNSVTFTMTAVSGGTVQLIAPVSTSPGQSRTETVQLAESQAAVIRATDAAGTFADYWVRCLPHDFPPITVDFPQGGPTPGWYVLGDSVAPQGSPSYAMILDTHGTPVWFRKGNPQAVNVTPTAPHTVAYLQAPLFGGYSIDPNGVFDEFNLATGQHRTLRTAGVPTDFHELHVLPNGHFFLLSYALKRGVDLTGLAGTPTPGPNSTINECLVQELDAQGGLVWEWRGSDHLDAKTETTMAPLNGAMVGGEPVYDPFHCNSIDLKPGTNDILVSARHLNAVFEVRRSDGKIAWKLGGKPVNKDGASIISIVNDPQKIVQQHDARYLPNGNISVFDNQNPDTGFPARAVEFAVNFTAKTATPVFSFPSPNNVPSCCQGSFRRYSDGHTVIGWGLVSLLDGRAFTELDENGNVVVDFKFDAGYASYRAVKVPTPRFDINQLRATAGQ